jgi:hypothetical protein
MAALVMKQADVDGQLAERQRKKQVESSLLRREEEEAARQMLEETRLKMEEEEAAQIKAKEGLKVRIGPRKACGCA